MRSTDPIKLIQRIIVISDDSVCRSEIKACHKAPFMFHESRIPPAIAHVAPFCWGFKSEFHTLYNVAGALGFVPLRVL